MIEYPKIHSIYKREEKTKKFILGDYSLPEFEYLAKNEWYFTEKVDGTNIRIEWDCKKILFGGRTENASIPALLVQKLSELFPLEKLKAQYPEVRLTLFGEGYGKRIQSSGGNYISTHVDFVLFDILVDNKFWLQRQDIEDIASKLEIGVIPVIGRGTLFDAENKCRDGFNSVWGNFEAEGIVAKPAIELQSRHGKRIITKIKCKDFK